MHFLRHCTVAFLCLITASAASAQAPATGPARPAEGSAELILYVGGAQVGREHVQLSRSGTDWIISATGKFGPPLNMSVNRFELKYTADWQPAELHIDLVQGSNVMNLATSFGVTTATSEITRNGTTNAKTDQVSARTIVLPNNFYAGYEALAARLSTSQPGAEFPVYVAPQAEIKLTVKAVTSEQVQTPSGAVATRRYDVVFENPGGPFDAKVTVDDRSRFVRLEMPAASLLVVRSDLATVATRSQTFRNPTDADVHIPAAGFTLGGTLTIPPATAGRLKHPAIVLVTGSGQVGRDETVAGIPIFAQLAGALADEGYAVLRYDKRGVGLSGGRIETVTLQDYADDLRAAVKWLRSRRDIDPRHVAVAGHSEGGAVAMLAAARDKDISAVVLIAAPGTTGAELILEQQRHLLDTMDTPPAERLAKIDLQTRIQAAVMTNTRWEDLPPDIRKQADSTWFRSLLLFDPVQVMPKVKQPILIVQGDLDTQVVPRHADRLAELARARKKAPPVEIRHFPGINHLLVPAKTGEVSEYNQLAEKTISPAIVRTIAEWLHKQ